MRVRIFETIDITERVIDTSQESATWNNIDGLIAPVREIILHNFDGLYSPNAANGIFSDGAYRNQILEVFDDTENLSFKGLIKGVTERVTENGQATVTIRAMDAMGSFLEWPVLAAASISGISTNASRTAGQNTVQIPDTVLIPDNAIVSTSPAFVPSYQVTARTVSSPNQTLTLDRGLEKDLGSGVTLYFSIPQTVTIPKALKDAFYTPLAYYGLTHLIGASFDALDAKEQALGHMIRQFVRREEEIELRHHIGKLLEMGGYNLTRGENGVFELVEKLAYDGEVILDEISDAEILGPVESIDDESRLLFGFSLLYASGNEVKKVDYDLELGYGIGEVPQFEPGLNSTLIEKYGATKVFKPIAASSSTLSGYKYLYANRSTAVYYGLKNLNYAAYGRVQYRIGVKPFISGNPDRPINLSFFKKFLLTMTVNENESYIREPATVLAYQKDRLTGEYSGVIIELTNKPTPGLPVA
ncbi:MAG: hypothetical protein OHK0011_19500 [Turneriella sp.]